LLLVLLSCRLSFGDSGSWLYLDGNNDRTASYTGVALDSDGVIWVSDGSNFLYKYANLAFSQVPLPAAFPYNRVFSLYPSRTKGIFAMLPGSTGRDCRLVKCFDGGPQVIFENGAKGDSFFEDSKGRIWSSDYDGSILLYKEKKAYKIKYNSGFPENVNRNMQGESVKNKVYNPVDFLEDSSGRIWAWTNIKKGENYQLSMCELLCFEGEQVYSFPLDGLPNKQLCSIMEVKPGLFWIGTYNSKGIWAYECGEDEKGKPQLKSMRYSPEDFHNSFLLENYKDSSGRIWFITQDGWDSYGAARNYQSLWRLSGEKTELIKKGLDDSAGVYYGNGKHSFCEDREGNLWVGTNGNGALLVLKNGEVREINWVNGLHLRQAGQIIRDGKDNIFFFPLERYGRFEPQALRAGGLDSVLGLNARSPYKLLRLGSNVRRDSKGNIYFVDVAGKFIKFDGKENRELLDINRAKEALTKKSNFTQSFSYFVMDSKDRAWLFFDRMVVIVESDRTREVLLDDAYSEIALKEDASYWLGTGDQGEYVAPVISKKRELFFQHWWGVRTIRVFAGEKWVDYRVSSDILKAKGRENDIVDGVFLNNDGEAVVNQIVSGSNRGKSFVFRGGEWVESEKYYENTAEKNRNKAKTKYTREYNVQNPFFDFKDSKGGFWILDNLGKIWYSKNRNEACVDLPGYQNYYSYKSDSILEDRNGSLWFCYADQKYAVLDTSGFAKAPAKAAVSSISFDGRTVVLLEGAEALKEPVTDSKAQFTFDTKEIQIIKSKYEYRLDGKPWRRELPGKSIKLEGLGFGEHFLEIRIAGEEDPGSLGKFKFTVKYDISEKLSSAFEKLKKGDASQAKEAMKEILEAGGSAVGFLDKKLKEAEDENLKWKIEAILSRLK